jgi:hypothetical protein
MSNRGAISTDRGSWIYVLQHEKHDAATSDEAAPSSVVDPYCIVFMDVLHVCAGTGT